MQDSAYCYWTDIDFQLRPLTWNKPPKLTEQQRATDAFNFPTIHQQGYLRHLKHTLSLVVISGETSDRLMCADIKHWP